MRRMKKIKIDHHGEFDLDLAPLLAVMVKLVPVLLVSSAFIQLMVVETELPQVVQQAIEKQDQKPQAVTNISLEADHQAGIKIIITEKGQQHLEVVPLKDNAFDYSTLHAKLVEVKRAHPEIFKLEINPGAHVPYKEIVKIMDEARRDAGAKFPVFDNKQGKTVQTDYMFPEIVFANTMEG